VVRGQGAVGSGEWAGGRGWGASIWGYPERLVTDSAKKGAREKSAEDAKMTDEAVVGKPSLR